ncbi:MAG TPA: hypothetical protein VGN79_14290 [Devosia sp.]|jgi:hypothetical protein|nr:hypothetical protein [Devosia sp.]
MKLSKSFSDEAVSDGTRTLGTIKGHPQGFMAVSAAVGSLPPSATLADARRALFDIDRAIAAHDAARTHYDDLLSRDEHAREGGGRCLHPSVLDAAREALEAAERRIEELAGGVAHA